MIKRLLTLLIVLAIGKTASTQILGGRVFLQGNYVEIGISSCGVFGTTITPPLGYHHTEIFGLSFVADRDQDGWGVGTPSRCGDYSIPGSPIEGFQIEIDGVNYSNTDAGCAASAMPGSITEYLTDATSRTAIWNGDLPSPAVHVRQVTQLNIDDLYMVNTITLINNSATTLNQIYYKRNIDPDNDQHWSGDYTTFNEIQSNPPASSDALVVSTGLTFGCFLGIGARSPDARVSFGSFGTNAGSASAAWNGTGEYIAVGSLTGDIANQISFKTISLAPGDSITYKFAYIFSEDAVEAALAATDLIVTCDAPIEVTSDVTTTTALFNWTDMPSSTGYFMKYRLSAGGAWTSLPITVSPSILIASLLPCTEYEFKLYTICDTISSPNASGLFTTNCEPCTLAPDGLFADNITTTNAKLHWNETPGAIKYKVTYGPIGEPATTINATSNFKNISGLTPGTVYSFKVRAVCGAGLLSSYSSPAVFTTLLKMPEYNPEINIFPNPASDIITVNVKALSHGELFIKVYDILGNLISEQQLLVEDESVNTTISIADLANGIYIVSAEQNGYKKVEQLVISK